MHPQVSTSKRRKISFGNRNQLDHINKLPDDLLLVILDKLPVETAISTSLLSKRWKDLWKSKARIDLGYSWVKKTHKTVLDSLYDVVEKHQCPKILCISAALWQGAFVYVEMGRLMELAALKRVEEIYLDMNDREDTEKRWTKKYPLLCFLPKYNSTPCSSLLILSMKFLEFEKFPPLRFIALRELFLEHVKLYNDAVEKITTNCPSLELLSLCNCNPTFDLKIEVAIGSSLAQLVIKEELTEVRNDTKLFIRAVNVKILEFGLALPRKEYHIEGILACSELTFRLNQMHQSRQALRVTSQGLRGKFSNNLLGLLNKFRAAKVLTLSSWCIQVLSIQVVKFKAPQLFQATHLTLETGLKRWEFPGIAYMLLACHKLKNLVIVMGDHVELNLNYLKRSRCRRAANADYPKALQDLTMVEFRNFCGDYQTWEDGSFDVDRFFSGFKYGALLLWNFRTYAKNLRKIVFITGRKRYETDKLQSFGKLPCDNMLQPNFYRVPHLFINKIDQNRT